MARDRLPEPFCGMHALVVASLLASLATAGAPLHAQPTPALPFQPGERLEYSVRIARAGASGHAAMWVTEGERIGGLPVWTLRFETEAGVGPIGGSDRTASWIDPVGMTSLRYVKRERHLLSTHDDSTEIDLGAKRWQAADGSNGKLASESPLDELSFIYFLRTLPHADDSVRSFVRHYDADRNPVTIVVAGHDTLRTKAGVFETIIVEMRVKDPRRYKGGGLIRVHLSDDARRLPVRIESRMPVLGATVLTLTAVSGNSRH